MGFPENGGEVLGSASDGCCCRVASVLLHLEVILGLSKVYDFNFPIGH